MSTWDRQGEKKGKEKRSINVINFPHVDGLLLLCSCLLCHLSRAVSPPLIKCNKKGPKNTSCVSERTATKKRHIRPSSGMFYLLLQHLSCCNYMKLRQFFRHLSLNKSSLWILAKAAPKNCVLKTTFCCKTEALRGIVWFVSIACVSPCVVWPCPEDV